MFYNKTRKGITIIELVLTLALIALLSQVVYSIFFVGTDTFAVSNNKGFSQQGVRNTIMFLESEFKYANSFYSLEEVESNIPNTVFYGLKSSGDYLIVSKYEYKNDPADPELYNIDEIRKFRGEW